MSVALIYPPFVSNQSGPPASLSALGPYLTRHGFDNRLLDFNIEFFWHLWNNWPRITVVVRERLESLLVNRNFTNCSSQNSIYHLVRLILPLLDQWRNEFDLRLDGQTPSIALFVQQSLARVMNVYYFEDVFAGGERLEGTVAELSRSVQDAVEDLLLREFIAHYDWGSIDLVGFSLLSQAQFPFAMLFATALRSMRPGMCTVAGGPYITEMAAGLTSEQESFEYFDFLVMHEGESALLQIANGAGLTVPHPNIVAPGQDVSGRSFFVEDIDALPEQDFSQFHMELYQPWGVSLPMYSSKGCTWGRCAFCSVNFICYRERDAESFFKAALRAARATGVKNIQLVDEDVTPKRLRQLAELSLATGAEPEVQWFLQTRFYPKLDKELLGLLARAGFSTIEFGLESANQRTLQIVKKGISLKAVQRILSDCEEVGIKVILNFMVGFPWETAADGQQALDFIDDIVRRHPRLDISCNTQEVKIYVHSQLHQSPERYGVISSEALKLSPTTRWERPKWVGDFARMHRHHLLFSRRCSRDAVPIGHKPPATSDPHITLAPYWYHLSATSAPVAIEEWGAGSLLVKAADGILEALRVNSTLDAVLDELRDGGRLSTLKQHFTDRFANFDRGDTLSVLGDALVMLNRMGALSFHAD